MKQGKEPMRDCHMRGSDYCSLLARGDCSVCAARRMSVSEREALMDHIDEVRALLPEGSPFCLYETNECQLCKAKKKKTSGYAFVDYGHVHKRRQGPEGQVKKDGKTGFILPLQIACCDRCAANFRALMQTPAYFTAGGIAAGLLLMAVQPIRYAALRIHFSVPLLAVLALGALGFFAGQLWKKKFLLKKGKKTRFDLGEIPYIGAMEKMGWKALSSDREGRARPVFSKVLRRRGWYPIEKGRK